MAILRPESLLYGVEDIALCTTFMADWGLEKVDAGTAGSTFKTPENQFVHIRAKDDPALPPTNEDGATMREVVWGVDSRASLDALATNLSADRDIASDADGALHTADDSGNRIGFQVAEVIPVATEAPKMNFHNDVNRLNQHAWPEDRARPLRIGHIVYSLLRDGNLEAAQFYIERLNFRLTDRSEAGGTFLRADGAEFHHSLFLFHRVGTHRYFNHAAYEVNSFDEIMTGGNYMLDRGAISVSGPGRHSLGSNVFWYFKNPCGGDIEYFADMDRMNDEWEPRYWDDSPPYARWMIGDQVLTG